LLQDIGNALERSTADAQQAITWLLTVAPEDPRHTAAAAVPVMLLLGTLLGGHQMARAAHLSVSRLADPAHDHAFYDAKLKTAWHYAEAILPRTSSLLTAVTHGSRTVMALSREQL
ncbi:MAG TPA: acyl-CoA dehydrogenase C-terminal domain-containing protein, partial [Telmatospirillum sp.]|nr:acyl-CoA dehydrogenase C-terminal domain-containing protein [Telmatospirillum sp.]